MSISTVGTVICAANVVGNTSGTAANVTGTVAIANGGTGQTTATTATNALLPSQGSNSGKFLTTNGTNTSWGTAGTTAPTTRIFVDTYKSFGSTNNTQMIFNAITDNNGGSDITYATASTGDTFTINTAGTYAITFSSCSPAGGVVGIGIMKNATAGEMQSAFPFAAAVGHSPAFMYNTTGSANVCSCSCTLYLALNDVITFCSWSGSAGAGNVPSAAGDTRAGITRIN